MRATTASRVADATATATSPPAEPGPEANLLSLHRRGALTCDVEEAHASLSSFYDRRFAILGSPRHCRYELSSVSVGDLAVDRVTNTMNVEATDTLDWVHVNLLLTDGYSIMCGQEESRPAAGEVCLVPLGRPVMFASTDGLVQESLRLPLHRVVDAAVGVYGIDAAAFRFEATAPVSAATGRALRRTLSYLRSTLDGCEPMARHPLINATLVDQAVAAVLAAFPHTGLADSIPRRELRQIRVASVRRAVDFIEGHAAEPLRLADVAAAAGVSVRALQAGFHRQLGTSPMSYLRRVRFERAHRDLRAGDPTLGDTVTSIAHRWGFTHLGRFATGYRQAYGHSPGETLHA
jgi:AraC-like DNA-binding protein